MFALEASRLARNNRDWHHLVDLRGLTSTLIIDAEGVYDPHHFNDGCCLGLKGTMSEWELAVMRQRSLVALRDKAERGGTPHHAPRRVPKASGSGRRRPSASASPTAAADPTRSAAPSLD